MNDARAHKGANTEDTAQLVTFPVGAEAFGLDIGAITEIRNDPRMMRMSIIDNTGILSGEERTALAEAGNVHP